MIAALKPKHVLVGFGLVFVLIGHLGDGTATREIAFWLGVVMSVIGLGLEVRDDKR